MDDERAMFTLETLRRENDTAHKEILVKLNTLCTQSAVNDARIAALESFKEEHEDDHKDDRKTMIGYVVALILLGLGVAADFFLKGG